MGFVNFVKPGDKRNLRPELSAGIGMFNGGLLVVPGKAVQIGAVEDVLVPSKRNTISIVVIEQGCSLSGIDTFEYGRRHYALK